MKWPEPNLSLQQRVKSVLSMVDEEGAEALLQILRKKLGLVFQAKDYHEGNVKGICEGKHFCFINKMSSTSLIFMILHVLGHYYFISEANKKNIKRYQYIYQNGMNLLPELDFPMQNVTEQLLKDYVSYEVSANNFATQLLIEIGFENLIPVIQFYSIGDINYIIDVTTKGKSFIAPSDLDYIKNYICANLSLPHEDTFDNGIFERTHFNIDALDWHLLKSINLKIYFF